MLALMESHLASSKLFHFKCFLYIQQDSRHLQKPDWENQQKQDSLEFLILILSQMFTHKHLKMFASPGFQWYYIQAMDIIFTSLFICQRSLQHLQEVIDLPISTFFLGTSVAAELLVPKCSSVPGHTLHHYLSKETISYIIFDLCPLLNR